ncbi:unnamed protein product [Calypogeia fissa]
MESGEHGSNEEIRNKEEDDDDDDVCLDASFFVNENYQFQTFTFGTETIEVYCLQSSLTDYDLTGQLVWPGAELLAEYLLHNQSLLRGASVLELGAGLGVTGLLCARYCEHVVLTDYHDTVLKVMQMNVDHQISTSALQSPNVEVQKLEWGCDDHMNSVLKKHDKGFDLIIGADICYQESFLPSLMTTIRHLLRQERARSSAILGYVSRFTSMDVAVIREASKLNLEVIEVPETRKKVAGGLYDAWIYEISLGGAS